MYEIGKELGILTNLYNEYGRNQTQQPVQQPVSILTVPAHSVDKVIEYAVITVVLALLAIATIVAFKKYTKKMKKTIVVDNSYQKSNLVNA
jgi:hypothetical protein